MNLSQGATCSPGQELLYAEGAEAFRVEVLANNSDKKGVSLELKVLEQITGEPCGLHEGSTFECYAKFKGPQYPLWELYRPDEVMIMRHSV